MINAFSKKKKKKKIAACERGLVDVFWPLMSKDHHFRATLIGMSKMQHVFKKVDMLLGQLAIA